MLFALDSVFGSSFDRRYNALIDCIVPANIGFDCSFALEVALEYMQSVFNALVAVNKSEFREKSMFDFVICGREVASLRWYDAWTLSAKVVLHVHVHPYHDVI